MRKSKFSGLYILGVMLVSACFFTMVHAQSEAPDSMAIQDVDAVPSSASEVVQEGIQGVETAPAVKTVPVSPRTSSGSVASGVPRNAAQVKDTLTKKQQQNKTIASILISIGIFIGSVAIFVFIMMYFFRSRLQQLLDKSSKDRKFLGENLKRFNIDIDKILPPSGPAKK